MPGMAPPHGMPPGPPGGTGGATSVGPMAGAAAQGTAGIKTAVEMLQKSLPEIPMGSDLHASVLKAISDIGKHMTQEPAGGPAQMQQLLALARQNQTQPPMADAMSRMFPQPGQGAPAMEGAQ